jgi:cytidylate kinase
MTSASDTQVITMWELYGCGMERVAQRVGAQLSLPVHEQAFSTEQIEESMAQREREGTFGRFLRHLVPAAIPISSAADAAIEEARTIEDTARQVTMDVNTFADEGGVILGRNGAFLLHERPKALHVKLVGQTTARVAHAAELFEISLEQSAKRQPLEDDFRRELSLKIFRFDPVGDEYYDLVIDATRFSEDEVVSLIVSAALARAARR